MTIDGRGVQSVEVGGRILAAMVRAGRPLMLRDLATMAQVAPGQAHAYLVSFRKLELVEQDPSSGHYLVGPFALHLGVTRLRSADPLRLASSAIQNLSDELGDTIALAVWGTHGPTVVQMRDGLDHVPVSVRPGTVFSVTGTATGRVFAAHLPEPVITPIVEAEMEQAVRYRRLDRPLDRDEFAADLARVRAEGFALAKGSSHAGIDAIAAPVFDQSGHVQLVVTLLGRSSRAGVDAAQRKARAVLALTRDLSARLGHVQPTGVDVEIGPVRTQRRRRQI